MTYESQPPPDPADSPELTALLAAAQPTPTVGSEGEERALAAFRSARDEGAYAAASPLRRRRRGRDDWRPASRRPGVRSVRMALGGFVAAATLGGVAVAAGSGVIPTPFGGGPDGRDPGRPAHSAPATPEERSRHLGGDVASEEPTATPEAGPSTGSPGRAQSDRALCKAYRKAESSGKAADATAFERLEAAAGSPAAVPAFCDELLAEPSPGKTKGSQGAKDKPPKSAQPTPGNGNGNANGNANGNGSENGNANGNVNGSDGRGKASTG